VDNLETVDDEELLSFLREIPDPTKVIVTTRHRIDIAYTIRLAGMPAPDAQALMLVEAARKGVELTLDTEITEGKEKISSGISVASVAVMNELYRKTGGLPLAIVWSIGLISLGHSVESVLRRLGSGHSDIARFCFAESVARIRERDAYRLLLALALFESHVSRAMLGEVAGLGADVIGRDDGLAELLQLSLVEQKGERFFLLPLTQSYALDELAARPELEKQLRERWVECLTEMARPYRAFHQFQPSPSKLLREGSHLVGLARWAQQSQKLDVYLTILPALLAYGDTSGTWGDVLTFGQSGIEYAALLHRDDVLAPTYCAIAWVLSQQGQHIEAERSLNAALDTQQRLGDKRWQIEILSRQAQVIRRSGDIERAENICRIAFEFVDDLPQIEAAFARAELDYEAGKIARDRGEWLSAQQHFLKTQRVYFIDEEQSTFNPERAWGVDGNIAYVLHQVGQLEEAAERYSRSLAFFREAGGRGYMTTLLVRLAALEEQRGNLPAALEYAREALEWSRKLGMVQEHAQAEAIVGRLGTAETLKT
jgi:LuxR family glucitol operon transcriptional activator